MNMGIILAVLMAGTTALPLSDGASLGAQAQAGARPAVATAVPPPRPVAWRASAEDALDLEVVASICRAAGEHRDPAGFLARLSRAYQLGPAERRSLRTRCETSRAGRPDARDGH
jgi:hypothetical protein